jgi:hypothetical protein
MSRPAHRARHLAAVALAAAAALLAPPARAAGRSPPSSTRPRSRPRPGRRPTPAAKYLRISPAPGTKDANPANGITVTAGSGSKISAVTVKTASAAAAPVTGTLSANGTSWQSTYALPTGQSYTVTATGTDTAGHPVTTTARSAR